MKNVQRQRFTPGKVPRPRSMGFPDKPPSRASIGKMLKSPNPDEVLKGVHFAGFYGMTQHRQALLEIFQRPGISTHLGDKAVLELGRIGGKEAIGPLLSVLGEDSNRAVAASDSLLTLATHHPEYFPPVRVMITSRISFYRGTAEERYVQILRKVGDYQASHSARSKPK